MALTLAGLTLVTPPATEPVTLAQARAQCRVDGTAEDDLLTGLIAAARSHLEGVMGRALMVQTWEQTLDAFPCGAKHVSLLRPPLRSVESIAYTGDDGEEVTWPADQYRVDTSSYVGRVTPVYGGSYPAARMETAAVRIRFVAGYENADAVPAPIKQAILLLVGHWYANRESVVTGTIATELPTTVDALVSPYRCWWF